MIGALRVKRVGTLQLTSYGITVITRYVYAEGVFDYLRLYIRTVIRILYIPSEPRFGDQYLYCSGIDFCLKVIF